MKTFVTPLLLIGLLQTAPAVDWYVATNGTGLGTNGWADATNNFQGAINASSAVTFDVVWVSNGVYDTGGVTNYPAGNNAVLTNRIAITKAITVRSKDNNPTNTIIKGFWNPASTNGPGAVRCVYMAAGSSLIGFMLTNGATLLYNGAGYDACGGGVFCPDITSPVISNCIIAGNSTGRYGGGAYYGTLRNCTVTGNFTACNTTSGIYPGGGGAYKS